MQHFYKSLTLLAIFCIAGNGLFAAPEQDESTGKNVFQQLDKNSDGIVNADEVPKEKERFFDHLIRLGDQNQDGKLTKAEFESGLNKEKQKFPAETGSNRNRGPRDFQAFMSRLDRNGDKKITKDEIPEPLKKRLEPLFQRLNKEEISLDELKNLGAKFRGRGEGDKKEGNQRKISSEMSERIFQRMDSNKDGKITVDEASERGKRFLRHMLEQSGKDADGSFSKKEFSEALAKFRPDRRPQGRSNNKDKQEMKRPGKRDQETNRRRTDSAGQRPGPAFVKILDTNRDGKLSKDELSQMKMLFEKLDHNKDGSLDLREMMGGNRMDRPRRPAQDRPQSKNKNKNS
ncbi:EF-hand domain-containing protein [Gimesia aquarii]|uniref:Transaldolase/EF-hand domain-containing protein n=1 Tax=Gimesia aquarii TaxID=2527964 RepID=A0A517VWU9_9PLAN|nr:EF-hand domain-containing protein [Gimesia aquarii]QDT97476.1 transaldolase/EF-hand domain-containing protein [Gimesia aquarii]